MKVLITGAGGFVGRHLSACVCAAGYDVVALLGPPDAPLEGIEASVIQGDIRDADLMDKVIAGVDCLIHAAGPPSVAASFADPALFAGVHVQGTATVMHAAAKAGVSNVIHVSSAEVYGGGGSTLVREDHICAPLSPYGSAKFGAEWMARAILAASDVALTILRPFSLYGPGQRMDSLIGTILMQLADGGPVQLRDLSPVRDYLHIADFCELVLAASTSPAKFRLLNACSGEGISVGQLAEAAMAAAGLPVDVRQDGPDRPADISRLIGCRAAAAAELAWKPRVSLNAGITSMISA